MATLSRRTNPVAEMLNWLEGEPSLAVRGFGLSPYIRIEDFVEEGVYVLRAEMPGIDPDKDVELSVEGDVLTIKGERREEEQDKFRHEFHYGSFTRSLTLPRGTKVDDISASYNDGVLELRVPMEGEQAQARTIPVQRAKS
jgi:HSP20 family molecular chaperone IbpA